MSLRGVFSDLDLSTALSTFLKLDGSNANTDIDIGAYKLITTGVKADGSGGLLFEANNGTDVALFGAGGGAGATFYGGVNVEGLLQAQLSLTVTGQTISDTLYVLNGGSAPYDTGAIFEASGGRSHFTIGGTTVLTIMPDSGAALEFDVPTFWGGNLGGAGGAGHFFDSGGNTVSFADGNYAINATGTIASTNGVLTASLTDSGSGSAGYFSDTISSVGVCDGIYALNAVGDSILVGQTLFNTSSNAGIAAVFRGSGAQSANLVELRNNLNTLLAAIDASGDFLIPVGSAASPSLSFLGDTNTGIYQVSADVLGISAAGAERFRVFNGAVESAAQVRANATTATTPGFVGGNDTNTGIFFPGSDVLGVATGGAERMRVDASGRVMIGRQSTSASLEVYSTSIGAGLRIDGAGNGSYLWLAGGNQALSTANKIGIVAANGNFSRANLYFLVDSSSDSNNANITDDTKMMIDYATGNVGINTQTPSARLHTIATTEQLRVGYDASNYYSTTVGSTGTVTFDAVGTGAGFIFSDRTGIATSAVNPTGVLLAVGPYIIADANLPVQFSSTSGTINYMGMNRVGSASYGLLVGMDNNYGTDHAVIRNVQNAPINFVINNNVTSFRIMATTADIEIVDTRNIVLSTTTGTKIGTGTTQKLGFWNATPVVRPSAYTQTYSTASKTHANLTSADLTGITSSTTGSALAEPSASYTQSEMQQNFRRLQDQINALRADLINVKNVLNATIDDNQTIGLFA